MKETVLRILLHHPKIESVTRESNLLTDFGLNSLDIAELVCSMEEALDIEISDKDLARIRTVGDILDYIDTI